MAAGTSGTIPSYIGHCASCDKPVYGEGITTMGKTWHPEHFCCHHCQRTLGTHGFHEKDGKLYCEHDYNTLFSNKCAGCNGPLRNSIVTALGKRWHPECFVCAKCHKQFGDESFHEEEGKPYCSKDYHELFSPRCSSCREPLIGKYTTAMGKKWHHECFVCRECRKPFDTNSFFERNGYPYCAEHRVSNRRASFV